MITSAQFNGFTAVSHLVTSALFQKHHGDFVFSLDKPNVIVGPNGSGKSALIQALALRFLCWFSDESSLDKNYIADRLAEAWWTKTHAWRDEFVWLQGMQCATDNAFSYFYRPGHIPGNETSVTHAMMTGYMDEARAYARLVEDKSSGQQSQAVMEKLLAVLEGKPAPAQYGTRNWGYGRAPTELRQRGYVHSYDVKAEVLKDAYRDAGPGIALMLMDEPEQSLDAQSELRLWKAIERSDCSKVQTIVATHSLYPLLHPERFNLIEAVDGYACTTRALLQA